VIDAPGLKSGDELVPEVRMGEFALRVPEMTDGPTDSLYGSVRATERGDVVRANREIEARGERPAWLQHRHQQRRERRSTRSRIG
jgi:hypothetical protein